MCANWKVNTVCRCLLNLASHYKHISVFEYTYTQSECNNWLKYTAWQYNYQTDDDAISVATFSKFNKLQWGKLHYADNRMFTWLIRRWHTSIQSVRHVPSWPFFKVVFRCSEKSSGTFFCISIGRLTIPRIRIFRWFCWTFLFFLTRLAVNIAVNIIDI